MRSPILALNFVSQLLLLDSGEHKVQEGIKRFDFTKNSKLHASASEIRIPCGHWQRLSEKVSKSVSRYNKGVPALGKIVPLKNIAGPESLFLKSLVFAAQNTKKYSVFENECVKAVIEFKVRLTL